MYRQSSSRAATCVTFRRSGACIGKAVQEPLRRNVTHVAPVFSLIDKEPYRVTSTEIDSKLDVSLTGDGLQVFTRVAKYEAWRFPFFVFLSDEPGENTFELELGGVRPPFELVYQAFAGQNSFERDEDVASK